MVAVEAAGIVATAWSISGQNNIYLEGCINTGKISGRSENAAGIVGMINNAAKIYNCQNHGAVTGGEIAAGIFAVATWSWENGEGEKAYEIANCSNTATIKGSKPAGIAGDLVFLGIDIKRFDNCFSKGKIVSTTNGKTAAIAYEIQGTLTNCYYLKKSAAQAVVDGNAGNTKSYSAKYMKSTAFARKLNTVARQHEEYGLWTRRTSKLDSYPYLKNSVLVPSNKK